MNPNPRLPSAANTALVRKTAPLSETDFTPTRRPISWKRNLAVMWLAQCVTIMGFSFVFPFVPLFVQDLGIEDPARAALWSGISSGAMGLTMFLFGPIWGMMGDRYGRKKNVLRAMVGGALLTALTGLSVNVLQLTALRFLTGIASGNFAPALALVAATSPKNRIAFGMGALMSAMMVGTTLGPFIGGFLAESVGFRGAFFAAGGTVAAAGLLVLLFVREDFQRPTESRSLFQHEAFTGMLQLVTSRVMAPLLLTIFVVQVAPMLMFAILPLLMDALNPGSGVSSTGIAFAILGITGAAASYGTGWFSNRVPLPRLLAVSCVGAGVFYLPFMFVNSIPLLFMLLALGGIFQGVLLSSTSGILGMVAPPEKQGAVFGALQSVSAAAFGFGPLAGGAIATATGLRSVFLVQSLVLFGAAVLVLLLLRRSDQQGQQASLDDGTTIPTRQAGEAGGM